MENNNKDWKDIHVDFYIHGRWLRENWESRGFNSQQTKEWIKAGFKPNDYWIVNEWKHYGFIPQQAKKWTDLGFKPNVNEWKNFNFTLQQIKDWIGIGLTWENYEFAAYLRWKEYRPNQTLYLWKLKIEFEHWKNKRKSGQEYLDCFYPKEQRKEIKKIVIHNKGLTNSLDLTGFFNLEELDCRDNQITALKIDNCSKLKILFCWNNQFTNLDLTNCNQLEKLDCSNNRLQDLKLPSEVEQLTYLKLRNSIFSEQDLSIFSRLVNLKRLEIGSNCFVGSLKSLQNMSKLETLDISNTDLNSGVEYLPNSIKEFKCSADERKDAKCQAIYNSFINEKGEIKTDKYEQIKNFPQKLQDYKQWRKLNFSRKEIKSWINAGAILDDYKFVVWFRDTKKLGPEWIANYKEDYEVLGNRFKNYSLCSECNQPNTGDQWCQSCNAQRFQKCFSESCRENKHSEEKKERSEFQNLIDRIAEEFKSMFTKCTTTQPCWLLSKLQEKKQWLSGNSQIDEFIQKYQLAATDADKFLEWIPYEQFIEIEHIADGGFGKVYKAKWPAGNIYHWDIKKKQWHRNADKKKKVPLIPFIPLLQKTMNYKEVVLKNLNNSQDNTDFLQETEKHKIIDDWFNNIVPCYGLSQDPETGNYLMVMQYIEGGDLRKYLTNKKLSLSDKLKRLTNIIQGLKDVHQKNLVHRDFHSGNILNSEIHSFIADLGLCKPVNEEKKEGKIYGVLPYIAPEVLSGESYTQASDVYSLGMIAYEIFANSSPYLNRDYNNDLALEICRGLRPDIDKVKIPQLLKDLIKRCWEEDPNKRPTANELEKILRNLPREDEFARQLQVVEEEYNQMFQNTTYRLHPTAILTSKLINTKEIVQKLQTSQLSDNNSQSWQDSALFDLQVPSSDMVVEEFNQSDHKQTEEYHVGDTEELTLDDLNIQENHEETSQEANSEQKEWKSKNFTKEQTNQWIEAGLTANEVNFAAWLRDIKSKDLENFANPQWIKEKITSKELDLNELRQAYQQESKEIKIDMQTQVIQLPKGGNN